MAAERAPGGPGRLRAITTEAVAATEQLVGLDPAFDPVVAASEPCTIGATPRRATTSFAVLARSICHQQLAGAAAATIHRRFVALFDGRPTPAAVLAAGEAPLRSAGLSRAKATSVLDLADRSERGDLDLGALWRRDDEDVIDQLVQVRGIGRWTAEMFLMSHLHRLDVWPVDDLGVRVGWAVVHGLAERPSPAALRTAGEGLAPVRSVAAWYCWRAVDLDRAG